MELKNKIPYIVLEWKSTPREDKNVYKFNCVTAIIKNIDTNMFLTLEFIKWEFWLVWWKIEEWENEDEAIIREVEEESWFKNWNIKMIVIDKVFSRWYKSRKNREEEALDKVFYVEVREKNKWEVFWADVWTKWISWFNSDEVLDNLTLTHHRFFFKEFLKLKI